MFSADLGRVSSAMYTKLYMKQHNSISTEVRTLKNGKFEPSSYRKASSQTFMMLFAALKVLSDDNSVAIAPMDNILALIQRDIKAFSDCNEISAREMFLES